MSAAVAPIKAPVPFERYLGRLVGAPARDPRPERGQLGPSAHLLRPSPSRRRRSLKTPITIQALPPQRQLSAGKGSCRPPATIYRISLTDGAGRALLRRDVPRGPPSRGRPLRQRRTLSPAPSLCCWQTALFEIMRMGSNRRPRMRSSSAAVAWTSVGCREAIDGLGGRRRSPLMVVQPHWQNGGQRCAKLVKHYASLRNR